MPALTWVRAHAVMITAAADAVLVMLLTVLHVPADIKGPVMGVIIAVLGFVGMIGLVPRDRYVPPLVGILKAVFVAFIAFHMPGVLGDPSVQATIVTAFEAVAGLLLMNGLTAATPPRAPAPLARPPLA